MKKNSLFWFLLFLGFAFLPVIYLFAWADDSLSFLGLPSWVFGMIFLQLLFCLSFYLFSKFYWREEE